MLLCVTASHKNADFRLLERLSATTAAIEARVADAGLGGAVIVSTCNRFEVYAEADEADAGMDAVMDAICGGAGLPADELRVAGLIRGEAVTQHLFAVSSGLESVVVGEGEVAGQVRRALERARDRGTTTTGLERLFQRASQTARGVKNATGIGAEGRSLVRLALDLAESRITDWAQVRVLLVGTGRYAGASLAALRERGSHDVRVFSPSGREGFAASHSLPAVTADAFPLEVAAADVIVTCSTLAEPILDAALLTTGRQRRGGTSEVPAARPELADEQPSARHLIIDLGLPRNVDPDVAEVDGVELLDLETIRLHAPLEEFRADADARAFVRRAADRFALQAKELSLAPEVVALRRHVYDALDAEIERARKRGDDGRTEQALRHLAGVLLHEPMVRARECAHAGEQDAYRDALEVLFGIRFESEEATAHTCQQEVS